MNGPDTKVGVTVHEDIPEITFIVTDGDGGDGITFTKLLVHVKFGLGGDGKLNE
tara:strand:+ start:140 stop:301 length:162 start_codon:yes stop_codon:yes gene_type:complete